MKMLMTENFYMNWKSERKEKWWIGLFLSRRPDLLSTENCNFSPDYKELGLFTNILLHSVVYYSKKVPQMKAKYRKEIVSNNKISKHMPFVFKF